jgi:hypothetical protein
MYRVGCIDPKGCSQLSGAGGRQMQYRWEWNKLVGKEHGMVKTPKHTREQIGNILGQTVLG